MKEAEAAFTEGMYFSSILCCTVTLNHLLFTILNPMPDERGKVPSTIVLVKQLRTKRIIPHQLKKNIVDFLILVRNEIEHKKSSASMYKGLFQHFLKKDEELFMYSEELEMIQDIILPYTAFKALEYYYEVCDHWLDTLIKANEIRAH